jgi:glutathione S-transferase
MLTLYHNALSSCSQKVRLVLHAKQLEYESAVIDLASGGQHDAEYVKLNPNHVVPTLVHDGRVLVESTLINEYLDDTFPVIALRPEDPGDRHAMRLWTKRIDDKVHPMAGVITFGIGTRPMLLGLPPEAREAHIKQIPEPGRRAARRSVIENGVKAPEMQQAIANFVAFVSDMETTLADGDWLAGNLFSLADAAALPYVLRLEHLAMGAFITARPRVADWLARVQALAYYEGAVSALLPEPAVAMFRSNGEAVWADVEAIAASL